jgi:hypothetical protein
MTAEFDATPAAPGENAAMTERSGRRLEILSAILLGLAATATAWSAYWSAIYGGDAIKGYAESNSLTSRAADVYGDATGQYNYDRSLFLQYAEMLLTDRTDVADAFRGNFFSENLSATVDWYDTTGDEITDPFDTEAGSPYGLDEWGVGNDLTERADRAYQNAVATDDKGDRFDLSTVFLALALFFGGIATVFQRRLPQVGTLVVGAVSFTIGVGAVVWAHLA